MMGEVKSKWPPGNEVAPPGKGEAERRAYKNSCKRNYNETLFENQGPRHIGEIVDKVLADILKTWEVRS